MKQTTGILGNRRIAESVQDIRWQHLHGLRTTINQKVLLFPRNWLTKHILIEDMKDAGAVGAQEYDQKQGER